MRAQEQGAASRCIRATREDRLRRNRNRELVWSSVSRTPRRVGRDLRHGAIHRRASNASLRHVAPGDQSSKPESSRRTNQRSRSVRRRTNHRSLARRRASHRYGRTGNRARAIESDRASEFQRKFSAAASILFGASIACSRSSNFVYCRRRVLRRSGRNVLRSRSRGIFTGDHPKPIRGNASPPHRIGLASTHRATDDAR